MIKKIFQVKKSPVRLIYENLYGTTIGPIEEINYISICFSETISILIQSYIKKFPRK